MATQTVAVVGASNDRRKFGNKAVRAFQHRGFAVVPINPHEGEVEGLRCYPTVGAYAGRIDMVTVYVPPEIGVSVMPGIAEKGVAEVWLNPGADAPAVVARARALGIEPVVACSIVGIGENPSEY